jgi:hypothetical protein
LLRIGNPGRSGAWPRGRSAPESEALSGAMLKIVLILARRRGGVWGGYDHVRRAAELLAV